MLESWAFVAHDRATTPSTTKARGDASTNKTNTTRKIAQQDRCALLYSCTPPTRVWLLVYFTKININTPIINKQKFTPNLKQRRTNNNQGGRETKTTNTRINSQHHYIMPPPQPRHFAFLSSSDCYSSLNNSRSPRSSTQPEQEQGEQFNSQHLHQHDQKTTLLSNPLCAQLVISHQFTHLNNQ